MATSERVKISGKIHAAKAPGEFGRSKDTKGRLVQAAWCGQRSSRINPFYVEADAKVTCEKCRD